MNRNDRKLVFSPTAKRWRIGFINDRGQWEDGNGATICKVGEELAIAPLPDARPLRQRMRLARDFSTVLRSWLTTKEMNEVRKRNAAEAENSNICHSHDFCDANMAMDEAFTRIVGHSIDPTEQADINLWNAAWSLAKSKGFRP